MLVAPEKTPAVELHDKALALLDVCRCAALLHGNDEPQVAALTGELIDAAQRLAETVADLAGRAGMVCPVDSDVNSPDGPGNGCGLECVRAPHDALDGAAALGQSECGRR